MAKEKKEMRIVAERGIRSIASEMAKRNNVTTGFEIRSPMVKRIA